MVTVVYNIERFALNADAGGAGWQGLAKLADALLKTSVGESPISAPIFAALKRVISGRESNPSDTMAAILPDFVRFISASRPSTTSTATSLPLWQHQTTKSVGKDQSTVTPRLGDAAGMGRCTLKS